MKFFKRNCYQITLLLLTTIYLIFYHFSYGFHPNNDTEGFIGAVEFFRGNSADIFPNRYLTPLYPVIGKLLFSVSAANSIIIANIIFYFGVILLTYGLISRVFKNKWIGFVTALLVMTSYAMVRYGLTQVQDMGGYFWSLLTIYAIWRWQENKHYTWLYLSSISVAFGLLTKESGGMGSFFAGIIILFKGENWKNRITYLLHFALFPFITVVLNYFRSQDMGFSSIDLFKGVWRDWAAYNYTFLRWTGVNVSAYNLAWLPIIGGAILLIKNRNSIDSDIKTYLIAVIPTSISYFAWPVFISRTVFISAWLLLPMASYALYALYVKNKRGKYLSIIFIGLLMVAPCLLQNTLQYAHVFTIIDNCNRDIACSWKSFWDNRHTYSKIM